MRTHKANDKDHMVIARRINIIREVITDAKRKNLLVGFVPTMGALHEGHFSLVRAARKECNFVVVSIFVNPTQFGPGEDYQQYPRTFKRDEVLLKKEGVDCVFYPSVKVIYPREYSTYVEEIRLSRTLCGKSRPGHFKGVCTVVAKLFNIVQPHVSYFGQKDYQQAQIIKRMAGDLHFPIRIKVLPIVRERDGLAMSSRNSYLSGKEREKVSVLYRSLCMAKKKAQRGEQSSKRIIMSIRTMILKEIPQAKIDYIQVVAPDMLEDVRLIRGNVVIALAVYIGKTRLIDNIIVKPANSG